MKISKRLSSKSISKQHCQNDLACQHCCSCWLKFKKQYQNKIIIITDKYQKNIKQIDFLNHLNKQLNKLLNQSRKKQRKQNQIQLIRQSLKQQIYEQKAVEDAIIKQKLQHLQKQNQQHLIFIQNLIKDNQLQKNQIYQLSTNLQKLTTQNKQFQSQILQLKKYNDNLYQKTIQLYDVITKLQDSIDNKTSLIDKLNRSLQHIESIYKTQKNKIGMHAANNQLLKNNLKTKQKFIDQLTKSSQQNFKVLNTLEFKNHQLKNLVNSLDCQVLAGIDNEHYLKDRLINTQEQLYISDGLAQYNSDKVQRMKSDLHLLKFQL